MERTKFNSPSAHERYVFGNLEINEAELLRVMIVIFNRETIGTEISSARLHAYVCRHFPHLLGEFDAILNTLEERGVIRSRTRNHVGGSLLRMDDDCFHFVPYWERDCPCVLCMSKTLRPVHHNRTSGKKLYAHR